MPNETPTRPAASTVLRNVPTQRQDIVNKVSEAPLDQSRLFSR